MSSAEGIAGAGRADEARAVGFALARSLAEDGGAEILARVYAR